MDRRILALALLCLFASYPSHAQEFKVWDRAVQGHGFFSQGFVKTDENNWLTLNTRQGSGAMTEMGMNISSQRISTLFARSGHPEQYVGRHHGCAGLVYRRHVSPQQENKAGLLLFSVHHHRRVRGRPGNNSAEPGQHCTASKPHVRQSCNRPGRYQAFLECETRRPLHRRLRKRRLPRGLFTPRTIRGIHAAHKRPGDQDRIQLLN